MARKHGIDSTTYDNIIIDSGAVYLNYGESGEALIGATRGGNAFAIETDYRDMPVDGAKGPVKGGRRIVRVDATLTANFVEASATIIEQLLPGASTADYPDTPSKTHDSVTRALAIAAGDYATNVAIVGEVTGKNQPIVCIVKNAINDGNFSMTTLDNDEPVLTGTFKGHFDPSTMDAEPWEIRYPAS